MAQRGYFGLMTWNLLTAVIMSLPSDFSQLNILRHQEMHIGTPEYRAYRHQGAVKNALALRQVLPQSSAMAGFLRDKFLPIILLRFTAYPARIVSLSLFSFK